jgi:hypothetical protein
MGADRLVHALIAGCVCSCDAEAVLVAQATLGSAWSTTKTPSPAPARASPRNMAPLSGLVTSPKVELRWEADGPVTLELARARGFEDAVARREGGPTAVVDLEAGTWFWRVVDGAGRRSAPWRLRVAARGKALVRQSQAQGTDTNGDGIADVLLRQGIVLGGDLEQASVALDPGKAGPCIRAEQGERCLNLAAAVAIGDVDGDGMDDVATPVAARESMAMSNAPQAQRDTRMLPHMIFFGPIGQRAPVAWCSGSPPCAGGEWRRLGDVDLDGYGDVAIGTRVFLGSPGGLRGAEAASFSQYTVVAGGGDLNGDGASDLAGVTADGRVGIHLGSTAGLSAAPAVLVELGASRQPGPFVPSVEIADLTGDVLADVLVGLLDDKLGTMDLHLVAGSETPATARVVHSFHWPDKRLSEFAWTIDLRAGSSASPRVVAADQCYESTNERQLQLIPYSRQAGFTRVPVPRLLGGPLFHRWVGAAGDVNGDGVDDVRQWGFGEDVEGEDTECIALGTKAPAATLDAGTIYCWRHRLASELVPDLEKTGPTERRAEDRQARAQVRTEESEVPTRCGAP